jgi:hypothetical protein
MLSRASIRPDLRFPGFFGSLVGESIRIFEEITRRKDILSRKGFMEGLDRLMTALSAEAERLYGEGQGAAPPPRPRRYRTGRILLAAAVVVTAGLTAAGFLLPLPQ